MALRRLVPLGLRGLNLSVSSSRAELSSSGRLAGKTARWMSVEALEAEEVRQVDPILLASTDDLTKLSAADVGRFYSLR